MAEVEIGAGKAARRAYALDDVAIVPSRRTRDPECVDLSWEIDAYRFDVPIMASSLDSVVSPRSAIELHRLGAVGVLNLEGLWTRYEDPEPLLAALEGRSRAAVEAELRRLYAEPVRPALVKERLQELRAAGAPAVGSLTPQRTVELAQQVLAAEPDLFVIQGTVVSAEHVARNVEPLNLKRFVRQLDVPVIVGGCASYQAALHLMRTGAAGVMVGIATGETSTAGAVLGIGVPQATAIAEAKAARMRHLDETGVYCHVIARGDMQTGGDIAKAIVCGADGVMLGTPLAAADDAPGRGWSWSTTALHPTLPKGQVVEVERDATLERLLHGPADDGSGRMNLVGALRRSMALCGYESVKDFQKAELIVKS